MNSETDDLSQGRNKVGTSSAQLMGIEEAANLLGITQRQVRKNCAAGKYPGAHLVDGNGGKQYRIPLHSLPDAALIEYHTRQAAEETRRVLAEHEGDARAKAELSNANVVRLRREAAEAGQPDPKLATVPLPLNQEERERVWKRWEGTKNAKKAKARAERSFNALLLFRDLRWEGKTVAEAEDAVKEKFGLSRVQLYRLREIVRGQDQGDWLPLLMPAWKGGHNVAPFSDEAWAYIRDEWLSESKPKVAPIYRNAKAMAAARGWDIPSPDAVEARIQALPTWLVKLKREGVKALEQLYPSQIRDYSTLALHDIWCADGRRADVFCRFPNADGTYTIQRPIIVAWQEVRSRMILGWAIGRTESADLIRLAFRDAAEKSRCLPREALMDNGRGFASKLMTGGAPTRFRFKVKEEDIPGILTSLGVKPVWTTPGHGQAKPIESFWRTLAEMEKGSAFKGAYCGNKPEAKPEEFDAPNKAVPIDVYRTALTEALNAYHRREHRGDSMNGQSPREVYERLIQETPIRQPTAEQLRLCLLKAEGVKLNDKNQIRILGNFYWHEKLADEPRGRTYMACFDPEDASRPVAVYDGDRLICDEARIVGKTGFRDQETAKAHAKAKRGYAKARKAQAKGIQEMNAAENSWKVDKVTGEILEGPLPLPNITELVQADRAKRAKEENPYDKVNMLARIDAGIRASVKPND